MNIQIQNAIIKAMDLLGPNGQNWIKDAAVDNHCGLCLRSALNRGADFIGINKRFVRAQVSKTLYNMNCDPYIPGFNDDPKTTFVKVKEVLEAALLEDTTEETEDSNDGIGN